MSKTLAARPRGGERGVGLAVTIPGAGRLSARHLVLDFNGTLAEAGVLRAPVARRLTLLAREFEVTVVTADTFGTAGASLRGLPLTVSTVRTGRDKESFVRRRSQEGVVAIGNGANDLRMLRAAALGIAVLGAEGMDPRLAACARIVVRRIEDALDLLLDPRRLVATLRT
jgi:soluble P-type ATPase